MSQFLLQWRDSRKPKQGFKFEIHAFTGFSFSANVVDLAAKRFGILGYIQRLPGVNEQNQLEKKYEIVVMGIDEQLQSFIISLTELDGYNWVRHSGSSLWATRQAMELSEIQYDKEKGFEKRKINPVTGLPMPTQQKLGFVASNAENFNCK